MLQQQLSLYSNMCQQALQPCQNVRTCRDRLPLPQSPRRAGTRAQASAASQAHLGQMRPGGGGGQHNHLPPCLLLPTRSRVPHWAAMRRACSSSCSLCALLSRAQMASNSVVMASLVRLVGLAAPALGGRPPCSPTGPAGAAGEGRGWAAWHTRTTVWQPASQGAGLLGRADTVHPHACSSKVLLPHCLAAARAVSAVCSVPQLVEAPPPAATSFLAGLFCGLGGLCCGLGGRSAARFLPADLGPVDLGAASAGSSHLRRSFSSKKYLLASSGNCRHQESERTRV